MNIVSERDIKFVAAKAKGMNDTQAGLAAGAISKRAASVYASRVKKKAVVRTALAKELKKQGITLKRALKPVRDGLEASKVTIIGKGDEAFAEDVPDHSVRLQASKMALDLLGKEQEQGQLKVNNELLSEALKNGSELDLLGVVFGKKEIIPDINSKDDNKVIDQEQELEE